MKKRMFMLTFVNFFNKYKNMNVLRLPINWRTWSF